MQAARDLRVRCWVLVAAHSPKMSWWAIFPLRSCLKSSIEQIKIPFKSSSILLEEPFDTLILEYNCIKVSKSNGVLRVTLNRPEKRNAFTPTTVSELAYAFNVANEDPQVKVVLLDAEGPVFCSGMDLKVFNDPTLDMENPHIPKQDVSLGE